MRILYLAFVIVGLGVEARAQGTLFFVNRLSSNIFAPVFDADGTTRLSGTNYFVQLYAGPLGTAETSLLPAGKPLPLRTGVAAGAWRATEVTIPSVKPGERATLQVRAWFNNGGALKSYEAALSAGVLHGKGLVFTSLPLGGGMGLAPSTINNARATNNLQPIVCTADKAPTAAAAPK